LFIHRNKLQTFSVSSIITIKLFEGDWVILKQVHNSSLIMNIDMTTVSE